MRFVPQIHTSWLHTVQRHFQTCASQRWGTSWIVSTRAFEKADKDRSFVYTNIYQAVLPDHKYYFPNKKWLINQHLAHLPNTSLSAFYYRFSSRAPMNPDWAFAFHMLRSKELSCKLPGTHFTATSGRAERQQLSSEVPSNRESNYWLPSEKMSLAYISWKHVMLFLSSTWIRPKTPIRTS